MTYRPLTDLNVGIKDGPNLDSFSRLRTSEGYTLFSIQNGYDSEPLRMEVSGTGTSSYDATEGMTYLYCTGLSQSVKYQSYQYIPYQPGKSQLIFLTGQMEAPISNTFHEMGYGDNSDGVFLWWDATVGMDVAIKKNGGITSASRADWNLDKLDGTGPSGLTMAEYSNVNGSLTLAGEVDLTKSFILVIDLQFLGMGRVRIGFDQGGVIVYVHEFLNAGSVSGPYMRTASLPIMARTNGLNGIGLYFKCAAVISEGGIQNIGKSFSTPEVVSGTLGNGDLTHLFSIRPKLTFNGRTMRGEILPRELDLTVTGANLVFYQLCIGTTFSVAPTFADVNTVYSGVEYGTGGTVTAQGIVIESGYVPAGASVKGAVEAAVTDLYPITLNGAGAQRAGGLGTLSVFVTAIGGNTVARGSLTYTEVR